MYQMDIQSRKINFVQEFLKLQNEELITVFEKILLDKKNESKLKPMSLEDFYNDIKLALDDSKNNKVIKAVDLKEKIKQWN